MGETLRADEQEAEGTMKLIYCPLCDDIVKLVMVHRVCQCGASSGHYEEDGINAVYWGEAIPLGFCNSDFKRAIYKQPNKGMGERFEAFVIPKECPTMKDLDAQED